MSDGVSETQNMGGALYGSQRVRDYLLGRCQRDGAGASAMVEALHADVGLRGRRRAVGRPDALLVLQWHGPAARSSRA